MSPCHSSSNMDDPKKHAMSFGAKRTLTVLLLLSSSALLTSSTSFQNQTGNSPSTGTQSHSQANSKVVYVCACMKTKSCSCMTVAKTEGPCACGTEGGPPLKAVPKDSDWAKENRKALAK